ncbi:MAG: hypothetical protein IV090_16790 [Candidatus Sericytochromatia bacterium]|nr:hypothetical protein [Candidatus Sericytochromatia bacterium]
MSTPNNNILTSRPNPQPTTLSVEIDASLVTASACNTALSNGLVAYYPLNGNGQESVTNAHGNLKGTTPPKPRPIAKDKREKPSCLTLSRKTMWTYRS